MRTVDIFHLILSLSKDDAKMRAFSTS